MMWAWQLVTIVKKKSGKLTMKGFRPIAAADNVRSSHENGGRPEVFLVFWGQQQHTISHNVPQLR